MDPTLVTFEDCASSRQLGVMVLSIHEEIVDRRVTEFVKVRKSPEDLPRVIARGLCDLISRRIR